MQKPKQPRSNWKDILIILSFIVALISIAVNGLFTQKLQEILGLESVTQVPTTATNSPAIPGVPTAGTSEVTQVPPTSTNPPSQNLPIIIIASLLPVTQLLRGKIF